MRFSRFWGAPDARRPLPGRDGPLQVLIQPVDPAPVHVRRAYRIAGEMPVDGIGDALDRYAVVPERVIQPIGPRHPDPRVAHIRQVQRAGLPPAAHPRPWPAATGLEP